MIRRSAPPFLLLVAAAVYFWRLGDAPVYLAPDEAIIATGAYALATTGRNLDGTYLPLYFYIPLSASWFMPAIYYLMALVLQVAPLAEWSIRVPTASVGLVNIVLTYFAGRRLLGDWKWGLAAAVALACAPAHFMLSRYAVDYIYPSPFVLAWLLCLLTAVEPGRSGWWYTAAGISLGLGWYSYISAIVLMPLFLILTFAFLMMKKRRWVGGVAVAAGFVVAVMPFAAWLITHPSAFAGTAARYGLVPSESDASVGAVAAALDIGAIAARYLQFFTPEFLFRTGDTYLPFSTRADGVFAAAAAVVILAGIFEALRTRAAEKLLVLFVFVIAPVAAALLPDDGAIRRATIMLPFGALLAAIGAERLFRIDRLPRLSQIAMTVGALAFVAGAVYSGWIAINQHRVSQTGLQVLAAGAAWGGLALMSRRMRHGSAVLAGVYLGIVLQFAVFQQHYYGAYIIRSAPWLNGNVRGALETFMDEADRHTLSTPHIGTLRNGKGDWDLKNRWLPAYWRFYTLKHHREDLLARTVILAPNDSMDSLPSGTVVLANAESPEVSKLLRGSMIMLAEIPELDRPPFFSVLLR